MSGWSQFGTTLTQILTASGGALAANPTLVPSIVTAAFNAQNPNASAEDAALAKAEAMFGVNPALAMQAIADAEKLMPPSMMGVELGLANIKIDTPPLEAVQAIEIARAAIKRGANG